MHMNFNTNTDYPQGEGSSQKTPAELSGEAQVVAWAGGNRGERGAAPWGCWRCWVVEGQW